MKHGVSVGLQLPVLRATLVPGQAWPAVIGSRFVEISLTIALGARKPALDCVYLVV